MNDKFPLLPHHIPLWLFEADIWVATDIDESWSNLLLCICKMSGEKLERALGLVLGLGIICKIFYLYWTQILFLKVNP